MAAVHPDAMAVVPAPTLHHVVAVIRLGDLIVGVDDDLQDGDGERVSSGAAWSGVARRGSPGRRSLPV